jgi:hypothetical protein
VFCVNTQDPFLAVGSSTRACQLNWLPLMAERNSANVNGLAMENEIINCWD